MSAKSRIKIMNISNTIRSSFVVLDFFKRATNGPTLRSILDLTSYYRFNELTKLVYTKDNVRGFYLRKEKISSREIRNPFFRERKTVSENRSLI